MSTPLQAPPFGRDTSATDQVRYGVIVSGPRLVAESIFRLLRTPKGQLLSDPFWGESLADRLGSDFSQADADTLPSQLEAAIEKDDRIDSVTVTSTLSKVGATALLLKLTIAATLSDGSSFSMVVAYQDLTVTLLELTFGGVTS